MSLPRRVAAAVLLAVAVWVVLTAVLFVWPFAHKPERADAVIVLSGDHGERLPVALRLVRAGVAPVLVVDGDPDSEEADRLCAGGQPFEVVCLRPRPDGTRPEARAAAVLASERRWRHVVVVTSTYHVTRASLLFRRCLDGSVAAVAARPHYGWLVAARAVMHEWGGLVHALTAARGC